MNYILTFLGFLLFIVLGMIKTKKKHPEKKFSVVKYLTDEVLTIVASAICAVVIPILLPEIGTLINPKYAEYVKFICFAGGYLNYSIINGVVNTAIPKKFRER